MRVDTKSSIISREIPPSSESGTPFLSQEIRIGASPVGILQETLARIPSWGFFGKVNGVMLGGTKG